MNELASNVLNENINTLYRLSRHSHTINNEEKIKILEKAIKKAYLTITPEATERDAKRFYDQNFKETTFYQIGLIQGVRLIGYFYQGHHFKVVLIDYHHSLFPDEHYNENDYDNYGLCFYQRGR